MNSIHFQSRSDISQSLISTSKKLLSQVQDKACVGSEWTGWWQYPVQTGYSELGSIKDWQENIKVDYDCVVVVGIGGSYLGCRAVETALGHSFKKGTQKPIYYLGQHLCSASTQETLDILADKKPIVCMISKSGTTTEPAIAFRLLRKLLSDKFPEQINERIVAITDPEKGALRKLAQENNWQTFSIPKDIGGRFSVLTAVGLVPLTLAGYDTKALLDGADHEFDSIKSGSDQGSCIQYAASRHQHWKDGKKIEILAYSEPKMIYFIEWWKQLFGESEGKKHRGIFPSSLLLTTDLHSLGQFAQDGQRNIFETFLQFSPNPGEQLKVPDSGSNDDGLGYLAGHSVTKVNDMAMEGTILAHEDGGLPCQRLSCGPITETTLGQLFAYFETACAISALMFDLNPFDQPGVEEYKKNLFALLEKPGFESPEILRRVQENLEATPN